MNLPIANIRTDRHVAPYVSLGRSRPDLKPVAPSEPRTSAQIFADGEHARRQCDALLASRPDMLLLGSPEEVAALDASIEHARIRMAQAHAQHAAALVSEAEAQAAHEAEQKRRKDLHRKAMKASAEVEKLATEYVTEAQRLVPLLERIRERAALIESANFALPDGVDPVPTGEPPCRWEGRLDQPHASIASRVRLPNPGNGTGFIWGEIAAPLPYRIVHDPR
ncbi:hypothetical protein MMSR116_24935 [Methylobacterium mesophilicum SR1.6/6]|uniref:Uncharacterized protein n=1 Tax=Methylobacterium mesophilicum SR1.6/6 TaxID=908290 RepID=A0A6B9FSF2_9HYPH|nr:hypothetical protein [Methylobacterium mesophilicum]QGY04789.1 hypothetical protein MMSR116_24935 [Methylobacterium mesophilicum SR1.6/6]